MSRVLRDINVGVAMMVGVYSGYYIFEPLIREQEAKRQACEAELAEISEATGEPVAELRKQLAANQLHAPVSRWIFVRK